MAHGAQGRPAELHLSKREIPVWRRYSARPASSAARCAPENRAAAGDENQCGAAAAAAALLPRFHHVFLVKIIAAGGISCGFSPPVTAMSVFSRVKAPSSALKPTIVLPCRAHAENIARLQEAGENRPTPWPAASLRGDERGQCLDKKYGGVCRFCIDSVMRRQGRRRKALTSIGGSCVA